MKHMNYAKRNTKSPTMSDYFGVTILECSILKNKIKVLPCLIEGLNNDIASSSCDNTVTLDGTSSTCTQYYILD